MKENSSNSMEGGKYRPGEADGQKTSSWNIFDSDQTPRRPRAPPPPPPPQPRTEKEKSSIHRSKRLAQISIRVNASDRVACGRRLTAVREPHKPAFFLQRRAASQELELWSP